MMVRTSLFAGLVANLFSEIACVLFLQHASFQFAGYAVFHKAPDYCGSSLPESANTV
jgi:hypothetical protein